MNRYETAKNVSEQVVEVAKAFEAKLTATLEGFAVQPDVVVDTAPVATSSGPSASTTPATPATTTNVPAAAPVTGPDKVEESYKEAKAAAEASYAGAKAVVVAALTAADDENSLQSTLKVLFGSDLLEKHAKATFQQPADIICSGAAADVAAIEQTKLNDLLDELKACHDAYTAAKKELDKRNAAAATTQAPSQAATTAQENVVNQTYVRCAVASVARLGCGGAPFVFGPRRTFVSVWSLVLRCRMAPWASGARRAKPTRR